MDKQQPILKELIAAGYSDSMCRQLITTMKGSNVEEIKRAQLDLAFDNGYVTICPRCHDELVLSQFALGDYIGATGGEDLEIFAVDRASNLTRIAEICGVDIEGRLRYLRENDDQPFLLCGECAEKVNRNLYEESVEQWPVEQGSS